MREEAHRLAESVRGGLVCESLHRDYLRYVERAFQDLRNQQHALQASYPDAYVRQAFREVSQANRRLQAQFGGIVTPLPPARPPVVPPVRPPVFPPVRPPVIPPPNPCGVLAGTYVGTCRSNAGSNAIAFSVVPQGNVCMVVS